MDHENHNIEADNSETMNEKTNSRRDFIKKFGKYGVATPVAMTTLMAPGSKAAASSGGTSNPAGNNWFNPPGHNKPWHNKSWHNKP